MVIKSHGEWRYSGIHSSLQYYPTVNGQLHALATLLPEKAFLMHIE